MRCLTSGDTQGVGGGGEVIGMDSGLLNRHDGSIYISIYLSI